LNDDREADEDLGSGDHHHEERDDLAVEVPFIRAEVPSAEVVALRSDRDT